MYIYRRWCNCTFTGGGVNVHLQGGGVNVHLQEGGVKLHDVQISCRRYIEVVGHLLFENFMSFHQ